MGVTTQGPQGVQPRPGISRIVVYNHPGSADGKYPPMQSPAIIQKVYIAQSPKDGAQCDHVDLFVMSNTGGIFFAKAIEQGDGPGEWNWPPRV